MDKLLAVIREINLPSAYDHFAEGETPETPYILYLCPSSDNFVADNKSYFKVDEVHIELYTEFKDVAVERMIETVLDNNDISYERTETWIESEKLYEVLYIFDLEA